MYSLYEMTHKQLSGEVFLSRWEVFLSQSAQSSLSLLAHSLSPQNAFGIQSSQSVTAKEGCSVMSVRC